jgi:hypothetical protein
MDTTTDELQTTIDREVPGVLHLRFTGKSASREAGRVLAPVFDEVLAAAGSERRTLEIHFERLEYFNSSTIAALVQFIRAAQRAHVPLTVVYDAQQKWQTMSFDALKRALRPFETGNTQTVRFREG